VNRTLPPPARHRNSCLHGVGRSARIVLNLPFCHC